MAAASNASIPVTPDIVGVIARHLGFQHLGLLSRASHSLQKILASSWDAWVLSCERVWGASTHWDMLRLRVPDETPLQFARRMVYPWVQPLREVDLRIPENLSAESTRAWQIQLDEGCHLRVTVSHVPSGDDPLWVYGGGPDPLLAYSLPVRPLTEEMEVVPLSVYERSEWDEYLRLHTLPPLRACVDLSDFRAVPGGDTPLRYNNRCWRLHAGVVVAAYSNYWRAVLCFFAVRDRRLLHFQCLPVDDVFFYRRDDVQSSEVFVGCPGEMWVLERWANQGGRLLHYGMGDEISSR
jgi:hypothetical protein